MGLLDRIKAWITGGSTTQDTDERADSSGEGESETDSESPPKLDPSGVTETRVDSTDSAVEELLKTRQETSEKAEAESESDPDSNSASESVSGSQSEPEANSK